MQAGRGGKWKAKKLRHGGQVESSLEDRGKDHEEREKSGRKLLAQLVLEGTNGNSSSLLLLLTPLCT